MGHAQQAEPGAVWRGRQPEPTPSFTKSLLQFPPLSSRGHSPVAIHSEPRSEPTKPDTRTSRHDGLPRPFVPRNDNVVSRTPPIFLHPSVSSRGQSPWRSTVIQEASRQNPKDLPRDTMDCRVPSFLAMTMW